MCTAKEALYLERMLGVGDTMGRLGGAGGKKKLQLAALASSRTDLVGHNEIVVSNGHGLGRTRLQDALLEEELKRSSRFCEQQNRLNKLKSNGGGGGGGVGGRGPPGGGVPTLYGSDFDLYRKEQDYLVQKPPSSHLWSSLKAAKSKMKETVSDSQG
ncbi:hypothetical protein ZHAS_00009085 [Anopheles sinensis]|uniref:Uncharacterized protein n=1 Tax=Anopheles sinensis TaxID=74873 RepID=A0A084VU47_ANOSI|nr:hypothetical protein ZHAS_00009085 [Anopheles sinensis]